ncbi:hypothetical protein O3M35_008047 [Rhynocoris fuscipes]|uniref:Cytochrome P450 n=1 Tax=Rhynocoris fuscipes TaxID=488301 RepID=A0AAW1D8H2_9HEMI
MWTILYEIVFSSVFLLLSTLVLLYFYGVRTYGFWKKRGVPYVEPKYPFFGNTFETALSIKPAYVAQLEIYKRFIGQRFVGVFTFTNPTLFVRDPELVEAVMIKDFTSFYNRGTASNHEQEPLSAHLFHLENQKWKILRQKLSPTFTSGKLKGMHQQLVDCSDALVKYINGFAVRDEPVEMREVMAKFTTDVIGSCAFGLNTNAMSDPDSEFRKNGRKIFESSIKRRFFSLLKMNFPQLQKYVNLKSIDQSTEDFFMNLVKSTMLYREANNVTRNDFVQLLMELKKQEQNLTKTDQQDEDELIIDDKIIAANAFVFFVAGFETTASTLSYCLYELSLNQEIQEQAYQHVVSVLSKHGGQVSYEAIREMTFLKQIFSETLRKYPPVPELLRKSTKDYVIPGTSVAIPKGTRVTIPVYSLHYDSKYFPEPEKFKPERFDREKNKIKIGTYLPFGDGPRICIGERFAKMEIQVALVKLLTKYRFTLNSKTISPLVYNSSTILLMPIGGIWIDLHKRDE